MAGGRMKVEEGKVGYDPNIRGPYDSGADRGDLTTCCGSSGETTSH
jgi:hypothetical protein